MESRECAPYFVDRWIKALESSQFKNDFLETALFSSRKPKQINAFKSLIVPQFAQLAHFREKVSQLEEKMVPGLTEASTDPTSILRKRLSDSIDGNVLIPVLENVTFYITKGCPIMRYNKSTYFDEIDISERQPFVYNLGCGFDFLCEGISSFYKQQAELLRRNLSTEICRDVVCGIRKGDKFHRLHIVQSNSVSLGNYENNLPLCKFVIQADPQICVLLEKTEGSISKRPESENRAFKLTENLEIRLKIFRINTDMEG